MIDNSSWTVAEGVSEDLPLIIRYRTVDEALDFSRVPHLVRLCWTMRFSNMYGLPDPEETVALEAFEGLLVREIEFTGLGVLALVITNNGKRDFYIYVLDIQSFVDRFHEFGNEEEPYPVQIEVTGDEHGEFYLDVKQNCS